MVNSGPQSLRVLLVEDSEHDAFLLNRQLRNAGYDVEMERVDTSPALLKALARKRWDIVFSDFSMPQFDGMQALKLVREHDPDLPFIIVSGTVGEERAAQLMRLGAHDYVIKGNVQRLIPAIQRELKEATVRREHRLAQEHIRRIAYYDTLTQLPNRHRLVEDIGLEIKSGKPFALLLVNLNNFREINGALGHAAGDDLIREATARLQQARALDTGIYHLHGNEFALLVASEDRVRIEKVAQSILEALTPHFHAAGFPIHVSARVGITLSADGDADAIRLLQRAELAAMFAKREGASCVWYDAARDPGNPDRLALLADLHDAIGTEQLQLVYQPKVRCDTQAVTGCEALLRWQHPKRGMIGPDTFIGMAERAGLIDDLAWHVVRNVLAQLESWSRQGLTLPVAINLSTKNLYNKELMGEILQCVARAKPSGIEIEITETAVMQDPERALAVLRSLYDAGIRIYIDDFGTGFSSLGYLKKLPIHAVKIDKSFVLDLVHDADSEAIVRSTIGLAHSLGLKIVAEGVENKEIGERLIRYGCDEGQGYYFSKPVDGESLPGVLSAWGFER